MKVHILGVCGTFMGSLAIIAKQLGHTVSGSDQGIYPPMSEQLTLAGIELKPGYRPENLTPKPDVVIVGNAMSRGNPAIEYVLNENIPYISGPQWLFENVLQKRHVLAVSGTHGKTSTSSMLAWILFAAGLKPGYLIGGVPKDLPASADLGEAPFFVIEADEYDTAFYDKRSKFLHYRPKTLIMNNLEFDHADIFDDLEMIKRQFQFLLRTVPANGQVIYPSFDENLADVVSRGLWGRSVQFAGDAMWQARKLKADGSQFEILKQNKKVGEIHWQMLGEYNMNNALAAILAGLEAGVSIETACRALSRFTGVKRRLEVRGIVNQITVYDDFAHHPTAIKVTLDALRVKVLQEKIIVVIQFASNTMGSGLHAKDLLTVFDSADEVIALDANWDVAKWAAQMQKPVKVFSDVDQIIVDLKARARPGDHILMMSNKSFGGIHQKLLDQLSSV